MRCHNCDPDCLYYVSQAEMVKTGASFCIQKIRYEFCETKYLIDTLDLCLSLCSWLCVFLQIFTDFEEIRQEIENETERISGNNKVSPG